jgi:hypothetical protein
MPFQKGHKTRLGLKHTEETKRKISLAKLGGIPWNKGKKGLQISWCKGKHLLKKHREKLSKSRIGKKPTLGRHWKVKNVSKMSESHRGEKGSNWKGGTTLLNKRIRICFKYRQWISDIFQRDNFTCQDCFKRGGFLEAHHKDLFSDILKRNNIKTFEEALNCEELWNLNNGITLCKNCHNKTKKK